MEIMVAKHAGFCFGVKRAIEIAEDVAEKNKDSTTYVFGQLVHNERVVNELEKKGIVFADSISAIPEGATTVLRAHGEPGTTYQELEKKHISKSLSDATCPLVTLVHNVAKQLVANGYEVALFGKNNHPEAIGTRYHIKREDTYILESADEAQAFVEYVSKHNFEKVAIISMTTMSVAGFKQLIDNINSISSNKYVEMPLSLKDMSHNFVFVDTICNPTKQRQLGTEEIARKADVMIVIGGKNSSNSKELAQKARSLGVETHFIQGAEQLETEWFDNKKKVGVSAGASTPDITITEVVEKIKTFG